MHDSKGIGPRLSVIMPAYNEADKVEKAIGEVAAHPLAGQIILIDDGSTDGTLEIARSLTSRFPQLEIISFAENRGKGAAVAAGFLQAREPYFVIQDCDLEYDPGCWQPMLKKLTEGFDFAIGNRFGNGLADFRFPLHALFNIGFSWLIARWWRIPIHDLECCTKMGRTSDFSGPWREPRFGIEVEMVAHAARHNMRVFEHRVRYRPRGYRQGKKIGWRDALEAIRCAWRYRP